MKRIVLLRHGESTWNKDNRFTGWTDVDLTEKGIADANQAGILLKEKGFHFDKAYTSFLTYIIHSGFISGYQNRYGDNLKPPTNVYHRMTA